MVEPWCGGVSCVMNEVVDKLVWSGYRENFAEISVDIYIYIYTHLNFIVYVSCMCEIGLNVGMLHEKSDQIFSMLKWHPIRIF